MYAIHNRYDALKARSDWPSISMGIYMKNKDALQQDEILSVKEWEQGVFFNSGMYVGDVEKIFLDNAPQSWRTFMSDTTRDPTAPAQYMAGWFYGVSQEDDRDEIMQCFKQSDDLTNKLYDAMEAFASGDHKSGDEMITETKALFEAAVQGCPKDLLGKMYAIHNRYDALKARSDWPSISMEIYMKNKDELQQDEINSVKEWVQGDYFNSGVFVGDVEKIFLDNAP